MKELKELEIHVNTFYQAIDDVVTTMRNRANQKTFVVKEYYLNCQPPKGVNQMTTIAHKPMSHTLENYTDDDLLGVILSPHTSSEQKYAVLAERTKRNFKAKAKESK